jgi:hypothetical protein
MAEEIVEILDETEDIIEVLEDKVTLPGGTGEAINSEGTVVATVPVGEQEEVADSVLTFNGGAYESLPATVGHDVVVVTEDDNPTGTLLINGKIEVPNPPPSAPPDPATFADAMFLFRSDASFTLVNNLIDVWPDASGNGFHAEAEMDNEQYRLDTTPGENSFGWKDVIHAFQTNFSAQVTDLIDTFTEFTLVMHHRRLGRKAPNTNTATDILVLGDLNNSEVGHMRIVNDDLEVYLYNNTAILKYDIGYGVNHKLVIVYDGTEATAADRLKVYLNGLLLTPHTSSGTVPASITCDTDVVYLSAQTPSRATYVVRQLCTFIPYAFDAAQITESNDFMTELWG